MGRPLLTIEKVFESDFIVIDLNKEYTEYADSPLAIENPLFRFLGKRRLVSFL